MAAFLGYRERSKKLRMAVGSLDYQPVWRTRAARRRSSFTRLPARALARSPRGGDLGVGAAAM
jgi:hypothetical protein